MTSQTALFTPFNTNIGDYPLPERFTFPFYYQPHPLCKLAAEQLQNHLLNQTNWQHNFGLQENTSDASGKMFGVLLVKDQQGEIGFLSAFSGKLAQQNLLPGFVPPVFDMLTKESFFLEEQRIINAINDELSVLEQNPKLVTLTTLLANEQENAEQKIKDHQAEVINGRKDRKQQRSDALAKLNEQAYQQLLAKLGKESVAQKNQMLAIKDYWQQRIAEISEQLETLQDEIEALKKTRKKLSKRLQKKLFAQYQFLNARGEQKDLVEIFKNTARIVPPAGAGECAAPKLLQYAFMHQLQPLAMAEFWWGISPKSEIRQHLNFYPSCQGKCQPILAHMLDGMAVDENPLLNNPAESKSLDIIYQDDAFVVVNKPAGLLSVPGKSIKDSVQERIKARFPHYNGSVIVHRLDMATSGLMVVALNKPAHKNLQQQFVKRSVNKCYVALLVGQLSEEKGDIDLPLRGDYDDLPRQLVCHEFGKPAQSKWQVIERIENDDGQFTKVLLYPKTGRTHQLRVHCAHADGLNHPIVGDTLYGSKEKRLHLHAMSIEFDHPINQQRLSFEVKPEF
ncbi:pseudouridine synthase [Thalassotalea sp. PLHSN55]|uniref:RluA family pseudouridine synthase n=1 Tax=Thalassotalea sp. PLHSN55 TaxID=3435888 RepID=UPI003F854978